MLPDIILVNPQMPENIGMVSRVMLNLNLSSLIIVKPRDEDFFSKALSASTGALNKIKVQVFDSFEEAIKSHHLLFSLTARNRYSLKPKHSIHDVFPKMQETYNLHNINIGFCFGCEKNGLNNNTIAQTNYIINIPSNPDFSSLNLAQSVAIVCYEYNKFINHNKHINNINPVDLAPSATIQSMIDDLINKLHSKDFFSEANKAELAINSIKNIYLKAHLSPQEVNTLFGIYKMLFGTKPKL